MSEKSSEALLKMINEISDMESTIYKVDGAIFVKKNENIIKEKIAYLYNLLQAEAKFYNQRQDNFFETTDLIIAHYKQKLHLVYDEFYCQYVNIQNEIQDARLNQKIAMINYQKKLNDIEENKSNIDVEEIKEELDNKIQVYDEIIEKCNKKFKECSDSFEKKINDSFLISSSLAVADNGFFQRLKSKLMNLFSGAKKYKDILKKYNKEVDDIDSRSILDEMREDTVSFVTEILELRQDNGFELQDAI